MTLRIFTLMAVLFLSGCASSSMMIAPQQTINPPQDEAQVVFMRSSFVGGGINATLYDVTDGEIKFIGIISNGTKVAYQVPPGKRIFMVVSEAADFMEAELIAGKNYYSMVTPRLGAWKARFSLWPIKNDPNANFHTGMPEFNDWVNNTTLVQNSTQSLAWYQKNQASVKSKYNRHWQTWQQKSAEDVAKRTLIPDDGI